MVMVRLYASECFRELGAQLDLERIHFLAVCPSSVDGLAAGQLGTCVSQLSLCTWLEPAEAMACGCCIVGSQGMPVEEAIEHNVEGRLIPMDQPDLLGEVLQLLASPQTRARFGAAARRRALLYDQRLTLAAMTSLIEARAQIQLMAEDQSCSRTHR